MTGWIRRLVPPGVAGWVEAQVMGARRERLAAEMASWPRRAYGGEHLAGARLLPDRRTLVRELPHDGVVVELGVDEGAFSSVIVEEARPAELHLVDLWGSERYGPEKLRGVRERFRDRPEVRVHVRRSTEATSLFDEGSVDWVYIDTDHGYEMTAAELRAWESRIRPGGYLAGHDFSVSNRHATVRYGVMEAVREFCVTRGWRVAYLTLDPDTTPSFALARLTTPS